MSEELNDNTNGEEPAEPTRTSGRARRRFLVAGSLLLIVGILLTLLTVVSYRYGVFDTYVKAQFVSKMADIGIVFDADVFRVTVNPLRLELRNATFNDKVSGDRLFFVREAHLDLTVQDLYAWQLSRDISIDKTELTGVEVYVKFDENGRSNFANLNLVEDERGSAVNFKYDSVDFSVSEGVVHFGDLSRSISGDARNVVFLLSPADRSIPDEQKRYRFDLSSTDSFFKYQESEINDIDIRAVGIADATGAQIERFDVKTPIGESALTGTLTDWASPRYDLDIQSTVDLTQAATILPLGASLVGVGNFKGKVSGQGESYKIDGEVFTESLRADGISLKGANVRATVTGTNSSYEADGTAIAQMLTFDDIRIDMLKLAGNVRGTGTDFRWLGDLEAVAAKTGAVTLGGLFLSDALAEYKDKTLQAQAPAGRAKRFEVGDLEFDDLSVRDLRFKGPTGGIELSAGSGSASRLRNKAFSLNGVSGNSVRVTNRGGRTDVALSSVRAANGRIDQTNVRGVTADRLDVTDQPSSTKLIARNLKAGGVDGDGFTASGVESPVVELTDNATETIIYSDKLRVAKIDTNAAVLGTLNIGGVRLTIREGRVEARSGDIDAGTVALKKTDTLRDGGTLEAVKIVRPVFTLEPSGRYRATADMSLGGGFIGSVALGSASAKVDVNNDRVALNELAANLMSGSLNGNAVIALNSRSRSSLKGAFTDLEISKLLALRGGSLPPIEGQTTGEIDLTFSGTDFRSSSGTLTANITANAGTADRGLIPISGRIALRGTDGLFDVESGELRTDSTTLTGTGRFDLRSDNSELAVALRSADASEIDRLVRVLNISPDLEEQLNELEVQIAGNLNFDGTIRGNLTDPVIEGRASLYSLAMRGRQLGSVTTDINVSPSGVDLANGRLDDGRGGTVAFTVNMPYGGTNNTAVKATLNNVNAGNLLAALPVSLPEQIRDLSGLASGTVDITGLPNDARGNLNITAQQGMVAGQAFDGVDLRAVFAGSAVNVEQASMRFGGGQLAAKGNYDRSTGAFDFDLQGKTVPVGLVLALAPASASIPPVSGVMDIEARARGVADRPESYDVTFSGVSQNVQVGENAIGVVTFKGRTADQKLTADLTAILNGRPQVIDATVDLSNPDLPFSAVTNFNQSPLAPFFAFVPQLKDVAISGTGTGRVEFGGNLRRLNAAGAREFSAAGLTGKAEFSQLSLQIQDTALTAAEPVLLRFDPAGLTFDRARFTGGGSNMQIAGTKALTDAGINDLSINGRINLNLLNPFVRDTFFAGLADVAVRFAGPNETAMISGTANMVNASVATFLGTDRLTVDRLRARIIFTSNQVEVEEATGYLGGGEFTGSGGGTISGFAIQRFRFGLTGTNVTVPLPKDFVTTGDAQLEIVGIRETPERDLQLTIGGRVFARRSVYSRDIDLANLISGRREQSLGSGGVSANPVRFDLVIEGRDALVVKNNIADLTASVTLSVTGDANEPRLSGRVTANSGTIFFRKDRYVVQRGVLEFPPETTIEPVINLQAESEIGGYQIFVNLSGPLTDSEQLTATVRSSPALPQADVVSLITTGTLTNSAGGIPTLAQTGINTAAEILTDTIINNPARKATDRLFGLNVFEIDPLISGQTVNPGARLTVGRQINNNLRVTYSTNLSQDQNQVLAVEYRVSNRLSFVAQYEQRSLTNVTRNRDNFSFEIRLRKRF